MRSRTAIRKLFKWGGAALTVVLLSARVGSAWWYVVSPTFGDQQFGLGLGRLSWLTDSTSRTAVGSWYWRSCSKFPFFWWFGYSTTPRGSGLYIPVWPLLLLTLMGTRSAWRADRLARREARRGLCSKCGYALSGLAPGAVCPECGTAPAAAGAAAKA